VRACRLRRCKRTKAAVWHAAALIHHMKQHAVKQCKEQQKAYAECVRGRTVSVVRVWLGGGVATVVAIDSAVCDLGAGLGLSSQRRCDERVPEVRGRLRGA
jgi:hypothetical protein